MNMENNKIVLEGQIISDFQFSHETLKEKFYLFDLKVDRLSENFDVLPVLVSERLVNVHESAIGAMVRIDGQIRSHNKFEDEKMRMILSVFVNSIENVDDFNPQNDVFIQGFVCKEPIYRKTPKGRDITDIMLAVSRPYGKTDYIPCICWGRTAIFAGMQTIGCELKIFGRFQSREYKKSLDNGESEIRTAFELSAKRIEEAVNNECED